MAKKKVLLVEDDLDLLNLMKKKLTQEGFEPISAETGQQALDYLAKSKPDLILLDILLPDIDGITVLSEIVNKKETKGIPVIILSNLGEQGSFEQVAAIGNYEYLVKAKTELNQVVARIKKKLGI
ncbi:MAG: hypothetical protein A3J62_04005 [Candidatus Buchananbacteria bacterium RIFCSPHIGHO2_02_FULL_38_8]|uniref:Response regulatory domain-containing protein n=2 Tax=Candidatus Buchananiibacteriota TaxID=1817903 RepID=A0A1G1Y131_9BACT|nr:MAG: hypothetical protein A2731_04220 [Candidatus Buchananbacteria bacterium RIFCSPHIGHO2_01_FULL_39_8]OGY47484.1 MAG: hypothetical protein A3J62_04005 [Candidatus Buchananbacteria bacterium RIFCSPHIGHO2_02_FULL_38_8]